MGEIGNCHLYYQGGHSLATALTIDFGGQYKATLFN